MSTTAKSRPATLTSTPSRRSGALVLAVVVLVAVCVMSGAVLFSGVAAPSALLDPGAMVRWGLPLVTVLVHLSAMTTLGGLTLCGVVLRHGTTGWRRAADLSAVAAIVWALVQALYVILTHASVLGSSPGGPGYAAQLVLFLTGIEVGTILAWSVVLTAATAVLAVRSSTPGHARWASIAAGIALMPIAALGHASSAGDHELAVSAMWLHLLGTSWWTGALLVLVVAGVQDREDLSNAALRFSSIAGWAVAMVIGSGIANAWIRMARPEDLFSTPWGQLLVVKSLAFLLLATAGWWHRRSTLPLLERSAGARGKPFRRLLVAEALIMAAVVGVSVALSSTAPPIPQADLTENAELISLPKPWFAGLVTQWRVDPLFLFLALAGAWVYISWVRRLHRRGDRWPIRRTVPWLLAMALVIWVTSGGLGVYSGALFSVHMLQHMLLITIVPIFLVLAAPVSLGLRALPRRDDSTTGPRELLLALLHSRWAQFFAHPVVASLNLAISMVVFYLSPLFELTLDNHVAHVAMTIHFSLTGYLFTNAVIGIDPGPRRPPYPLRLVLLLPSVVFHTFFGLFLTSSDSLLASSYFLGVNLPWADPVADQKVGGAVAWALGETPVVVLAFLLAAQWAAHEERARRRIEQRTAEPHAGPHTTIREAPSGSGSDDQRTKKPPVQ